MDRKFIYIITVMEKFNKEEDNKGHILNVSTGNKRTPIICDSLEKAKDIINNNICDIQEWFYHLACIEKIEINEFYPCVIETILFKFDDKNRRFYQIDKIKFPVYTICEVG